MLHWQVPVRQRRTCSTELIYRVLHSKFKSCCNIVECSLWSYKILTPNIIDLIPIGNHVSKKCTVENYMSYIFIFGSSWPFLFSFLFSSRVSKMVPAHKAQAGNFWRGWEFGGWVSVSRTCYQIPAYIRCIGDIYQKWKGKWWVC